MKTKVDPKIENEVSSEKEKDSHKEEDSIEGTEKKLSDLMEQGWIMLS